MDRDKLFRYLNQRYCSKREMLSRIPLGVQPDALWQDLLNHRRSRSATLPLYSHTGFPYWYVTTEKMISASEKIIEAIMEYETETGAAVEAPPVSTLEEVFYTSYVEGAQITMQEAMDFLTGDLPPRCVEEQMIANNRMAGSYAGANLYRNIDPALLQELAFLLTDGMDNGGQEYRSSADVDFASADGEAFEFPGPHVLPECVSELCAYLADRTVHPLIKAAVAQAYVFVVCPFPEGNERLGRILSSMILLRAGYGFFGEVSLSALIARKNYAYYEAMANVLRTENGNDMTYFMEFFLELLSRAVDERRLRIRQRDEQDRQAELELARTALTPPVPAAAPELQETASLNGSPEGNLQPAAEAEALPEPADQEADLLEGFTPVSELDLQEDEEAQEDEALCLARVRDVLYDLAENGGEQTGASAIALLRLLGNGVTTFTTEEIRDGRTMTRKQSSNMTTRLKEKGVIENTGERRNGRMVYRFGTRIPPLMPKDYDPAVIVTVKELMASRSQKDRRIGEIICGCMAKGMLTLEDYASFGDGEKMGTDMLLPLRMGLLTKLDPCVYRINRAVAVGAPVITNGQKEILTALYHTFRSDTFTMEDAATALDFSRSSISQYLHQFVLLRILECTGKAFFTYRLLINPDEHPELFAGQEAAGEDATEDLAGKAQDDAPAESAEADDARQQPDPNTEQSGSVPGIAYSEEIYNLLDRLEASENSNKDRRLAGAIRQCLNKAIILESDYEKWGYTHNMWLYDTTLAKQLGLVRMLGPDAYAINKKLRPELEPKQKKTISAIYETFGDKEFSSEMFIATLNYSPSYTYAYLHKLTLLRILGQRSTEDGSQYQLLVNPEDHPECFETAA